MIRINAAAGKEGYDWFIDLAKHAKITADPAQGISLKKKAMVVNNVETKMIEEPQLQVLMGVPTGT